MSKQLTAHVSLDFLHYTPEKKVPFTSDVITDMSKNTDVFATPDVSLEDLKKLRDILNDKNTAAAGGDHTAILERNVAEKNLDGALRTDASYVSHIAKGDLVIIAKSGFHATHNEAHPVVRPGKAVLETYGNKKHGSIHAQINALPGSKGNLFIAVANMDIKNVAVTDTTISFTINGNPLVLALGTKHTVDLDGLVTGTNFTVAGLGFNSAGLGDPSEPQTVLVP